MVRLTVHLDMTIAVDWDVKQQTNKINQKMDWFCVILMSVLVYIQ